MQPGDQRAAGSRSELAERWRFLDEDPDGYAVLSDRMEVLWMNRIARSVAPGDAWGLRCWETFPVGSESCAARCPAARAVRAADEIVYCEETLYPAGKALVFGVAVIPIDGAPSAPGERALVLLRPRSMGEDADAQRRAILETARRVREKVAPSENVEPPPST